MYLFPVFLPLISFFIFIFLSNFINKKILVYISTFNIFLATFISFLLIKDVVNTNYTFEIYLFHWLSSGNLISNWTINIDFLTSTMILIVNLISALVQFYSIGYMREDKSIARFFCYLNLFSFFMLILVSSGNLLQLYLGWEGVGLCSYLLISFWFYKKSASNASLKAFIVNRVGDMFFILGIILIYLTFDSITFTNIFSNLKDYEGIKYNFLFFDVDVINIICLFLILGAMGKSAQIGFHTWLPDAMEAPTPVSALIHAATMVTAGVFLICKMSFFFNSSIFASNFIVLIGSITAIFAASVALTHNDIKKIIAYSTCSQLGFMFIAAGFSLYNLAIFHLVIHAFFKSLLFLGAGSVIHSLNHEQNIKKMGKLWKKLPLTYIVMIIGSLALSGIPFFSGYYSKELIINSGLSSDLFLSRYVYFISIITALLTSAYSFRLIYYVFHGPLKFSNIQYNKIKETSFYILSPLILLSFLAVFSGYFLKDFFISDKYAHLWVNANVENLSDIYLHQKNYLINFIPTIFAFLGILLIFYIYFFKQNLILLLKKKFSSIYRFLLNKGYFDEFYNYLFVKNIINLSENLWKKIDIGLIDRLGPNAIALSIKNISKFFSNLQTGYIYHYVLSFAIGITLLISFIIFFL